MKPVKRGLLAASALSVMLMLGGCGDLLEQLNLAGEDSSCKINDAGEEVCSASDLDSFDQEVKTDKVSAKLSGVVQLTNTSGAFSKPGRAPKFAADVSGQTLEGTPAPKTLVLAVDAWGNTVSDQADSVGGFDMELDAGKLYAIIFIDIRSMEVLGSLVQASNTEAAAAVALADNTALGNVVIDPVSGRAVAEADATPDSVVQEGGVKINVVDASALDADGDGKITQDDITKLQALALESGEGKIGKVSPLNFMGDRNTWVAGTETRHENWEHSFTDQNSQQITESFNGDVTEGRFTIRREKLVDGPQGGQITALKSADVTYYRHQKGTRSRTGEADMTVDDGGYYWGLIAKANAGKIMPNLPDGTANPDYATDYAKLPATCQAQIDQAVADSMMHVWCGEPFQGTEFRGLKKDLKFTWESGLWAWARYEYADTDAGFIVEGQWNHEERKVQWDGGGIPLELEMGQVIDNSWTDSWTEQDGTVHKNEAAFQFKPSFVDGLMDDALGNKLPIIKIEMVGGSMKEYLNGVLHGEATFTVADGGTFTKYNSDGSVFETETVTADQLRAQGDDGFRPFYLLAKYGAQVPAEDASGNAIAWQDAFKDVRFGIISKSVDTTKANDILANKCATAADKAILTKDADHNLVICKATPEKLLKADGAEVSLAGALPGAAGDADKRNSWLAFLARNINQLEAVDFNNFEDQAGGQGPGGGGNFWVEQSESLWTGVEPLSWDPVNYIAYPLKAGTTQQFVTTKTPDTTVGGETTDDANVHYRGKNVSFVMELRVWDPAANKETAIAKSAAITGMPDVGFDAAEDGVVSLDTTIAIPALGKASTTYPETWTWYEWDPNTNTETKSCSAGASIFVVMFADDGDDANGVDPVEVMAQPIGWVDIRGDVVTDNCDKFATAP